MFIKSIDIAAVGTSELQGYLHALRKAEKAGPVRLGFRREPKNEKLGPTAIAIIANANGKHYKVGYVPTNKAFWLSKRIDAGDTVRVYAQKDADGNRKSLVVGGGKATLGMRCAFSYDRTDAIETAVETEEAEA